MLLTHPAAKPGVSVYFFSFFFVPLLNSDIFQFSIWLLTAQEGNSQDLEEFCTTKQKTTLVHTCSIQTLVWKQHHADHVSCNCPQNSASYSYLIQALKKPSKHHTREGRKARDLILQQFATLVLHPAVNYVPFNATIMANGYRADKNTK